MVPFPPQRWQFFSAGGGGLLAELPTPSSARCPLSIVTDCLDANLTTCPCCCLQFTRESKLNPGRVDEALNKTSSGTVASYQVPAHLPV